MSLKGKMIALCLLASFIPLCIIGYYSVNLATDILQKRTYSQLESLRDLKKYSLQKIINRWMIDLEKISSEKDTLKAYSQFMRYLKSEDVEPGQPMNVQNSYYQKLHEMYGSTLAYYVKILGYEDVLLIEPNGRIIFTVAKKPDIGQDLAFGELRDSHLAKSWRAAAQEGKIVFTDVKPYPPYNNQPSAFLISPLKGDQENTGYVALKISFKEIKSLMNLRPSLGNTGETILVGQDYLMRSDSYLDPENHSLEASFLNPDKGRVQCEAITLALAGKSGLMTDVDYRGEVALSAYAPITIKNVVWGLIVKKDRDEAFAEVRTLKQASFIVGGATITLVTLIMLYFLRRELIKPISSLKQLAQKVADGDLEVKVEGKFKAELKELFEANLQMVQHLKEKINQANMSRLEAQKQTEKAQKALSEANEARKEAEEATQQGMLQAAQKLEGIVEEITTESDLISAKVAEVSKGVRVQQSQIQEMTTAMEQINTTVIDVAKNASEAANSARDTKDKAANGFKIVEKAIAAIDEVNDMSSNLKDNLHQLGVQVEAINQVMDVINDIADQTNLLALNAAIEAARAGDAGRGFAVVADEVRKLAERTMGATHEVGETISKIINSTQQNIDHMDGTVTLVAKATELANKSGETLREIVDLSEHTSIQIQNIATATEEQSQATEEISRTLEGINDIANTTSEEMMHSAQAIQGLAEEVKELKGLVQELKGTN